MAHLRHLVTLFVGNAWGIACAAEARLHDRQHHQASPRVLRQGIVRRRTQECVRHVAGSPVQADDTDGKFDKAPGSTEERCSLDGGDERDAVLNGGLA